MHEKGGYRVVSNLAALMEVDFKDIGAVLGKGNNGIIFELLAVIKFQLDNRQHNSIEYREERQLTRLIYLQF
jgi:hypothetical protein